MVSNSNMIINLAVVILSYLIGSISAAILVCRLGGFGDPRQVGSGNPGATNVLRNFGKGAAFATLAGDVGKGFLPVLAAKLLGLPPWLVAAAGCAAFCGHLYPVFFQFRGGKGVATLIGVLFALKPILGIVFCGVWLTVAAITRYSSLSALVATALSPLVAWWFGLSTAVIWILVIMVILVFWRHRSNMQKLLSGNESKMGRKAA